MRCVCARPINGLTCLPEALISEHFRRAVLQVYTFEPHTKRGFRRFPLRKTDIWYNSSIPVLIYSPHTCFVPADRVEELDL